MNYKDIIDGSINAVYQKGIATKILQHMDRIRNASDVTQARRWVMELIQNARDVSYEESPVKIKISYDNEHLSFKHSGKPFRVKDLISIINQVSSKTADEGVIGRFGTGFVSTFLLSEVVEINSVIKNEDLPYKGFNIALDRHGHSQEEILSEIDKTMAVLKEVDRNCEITDFNCDEYNTEFVYHIENEESRQSMLTGLNDLRHSVLYILLFSKKIQSIEICSEIKGAEESCIFTRNDCNTLADIGVLTISETTSHYDESKNTEHTLVFAEENGLSIAAEAIGKSFIPIQSEISRVFIDFPLIGTEKFPFPIVMNSRDFMPNEPRSGLPLVDNVNSPDSTANKELLTNAIKLYLNFILSALKNGYDGFENIVSVHPYSQDREVSETWIKANVYKSLYKKYAVFQ